MQLLDFMVGLGCLLICFAGAVIAVIAVIIEKRKNNRKYLIAKVTVGTLTAVGIVLLPYLEKDTYRGVFVWCSPLVFVAGFMAVVCVGLYVGICIKNRVKAKCKKRFNNKNY